MKKKMKRLASLALAMVMVVGAMVIMPTASGSTALSSPVNYNAEIKESSSPGIQSGGKASANPYLPLWEHVPDGETRVFEDPDNPGKFRAYLIGSHDQKNATYCGPDIVMWSAPLENLNDWRCEGPIYTFRNSNGRWATMFAPDLVEVMRFAPEIENGTRQRTASDVRTVKEYYLYPHPNTNLGIGIVTKSITGRPEGPYTEVNLAGAGGTLLPGSVIGFDPSVLLDYVDDPADPDYNIGFRAYCYWGWQQCTAAELNQKTMYSVRPLGPGETAADYPGRGTQYDFFLPVSSSYGVIRPNSLENSHRWRIMDPENASQYNYFEAFAVRKVEVPGGNDKFLVIFSGYSGPDYGMGSTNSAMRYLYGDSPLGPFRVGGVIVDSRGPVPNETGSALVGGAWGHNTHGGPWLMNGQWYIAYHRPPRGGGGNRQAMVAPIKVDLSEAKQKVADGGKLTIRAYDPFAPDEIWTAQGGANTYTGAEVTSEGFNIFGLPPYQYYSAGYVCYAQGGNANGSIQDSWDIWDNNMPLIGLQNGSRLGYKYFGFGGLDQPTKGLLPFEGTKPGNNTKFNLWATPRATTDVTVQVWLNGPWDNATWKGINIGTITIPAGSALNVTQRYQLDVSQYVDSLTQKNAIYLVVGGGSGALCDIIGLGFSKDGLDIERPVMPTLGIQANGEAVTMPAQPIFYSDINGAMGFMRYAVNHARPTGAVNITATCSDPEVKILVTQPSATTGLEGAGIVRFVRNGVMKMYRLFHTFGTAADGEVSDADAAAILEADKLLGGGSRLTVNGTGLTTTAEKIAFVNSKVAALLGASTVTYTVTHVGGDAFSLRLSRGYTSMTVNVDVKQVTVEGYNDLEAVISKTQLDIGETVGVTINAIHKDGAKVNVTSSPNLSVTVGDGSMVSYEAGVLKALALGKTALNIAYTDPSGTTLCLAVILMVGAEVEPSATSISVNGKPVTGFSPSLRSYTLAAPVAQTMGISAVLPTTAGLSYTVDYPASMPGTATVTVASVWGKSRTYTLNLSYATARVSDLRTSTMTFTADLGNPTDEVKYARVIAAAYDAGGRLVEIKPSARITIPANGYVDAVSEALTIDAKAHTFRGFIWDDDRYTPYSFDWNLYEAVEVWKRVPNAASVVAGKDYVIVSAITATLNRAMVNTGVTITSRVGLDYSAMATTTYNGIEYLNSAVPANALWTTATGSTTGTLTFKNSAPGGLVTTDYLGRTGVGSGGTATNVDLGNSNTANNINWRLTATTGGNIAMENSDNATLYNYYIHVTNTGGFRGYYNGTAATSATNLNNNASMKFFEKVTENRPVSS